MVFFSQSVKALDLKSSLHIRGDTRRLIASPISILPFYVVNRYNTLTGKIVTKNFTTNDIDNSLAH